MSIKTIYKALIDAGLTPEGACGLMGNMMAESSMKADIAQRGMTALSDEQYTAAADAGTIDFVHDPSATACASGPSIPARRSCLPSLGHAASPSATRRHRCSSVCGNCRRISRESGAC